MKLKLARVPASSPLPVTALPSMSLIPSAPLKLAHLPACSLLPSSLYLLCLARRSLSTRRSVTRRLVGEGGSLVPFAPFNFYSGAVHVRVRGGGDACALYRGRITATQACRRVVKVQLSLFFPTTLRDGRRPRKSLRSTRLVSGRGSHAAIQLFLSHNSARYMQAVTADSMSCTVTHSSGPCALCSPQNRFGVGRPSSVRREPSVPPRMT